MSNSIKPSSRDDRFAEVFGAPLDQLLAAPAPSRHLREALELRAFLAVTEDHVVWVRDRVHERSDPNRPLDELSEDDLRSDAEWMRAALQARRGYLAALDKVLNSEPPPEYQPAVVFNQPVLSARAVPAERTIAPQVKGR
ncbi:hypothetical protein [Streptomyces sp. CC208A]|uniref:hypothetical protein n=1 Tax=Streptomyces sp. CC208A TaxID=3044573 RepID=UPI0024A85F5B|nr:hypothetical protein [Streptomyces sp. CC208A]